MATKETFHRDLGTTSYKQFDSKWADQPTSCGGTIKSEGCFITSVAMIFHSFGDTNVDPSTLQIALEPYDCPFYWTVAADKYGHTYHGKTYGAIEELKYDMFDLIYNQGIPVMVHVPGHLVVVKEFYGTLTVDDQGNPFLNEITPDMFKVNDPGSSYNDDLQDVIDQRGEVEYYNYYTK
jgi:hypothetical protein